MLASLFAMTLLCEKHDRTRVTNAIPVYRQRAGIIRILSESHVEAKYDQRR